MQMQTKTMSITPAIAREMLKKNTNNRPIKQSHVEALRQAMLRGEWRCTHQGIGFSDTGVLLDGQHRLEAIARLPDMMQFQMNVTTGLNEAAFNIIDRGMMRSLADAIRHDPRLTSAARLIAALCNSSLRSSPTPDMVLPYVACIKDEHDALIAACPAVSRTWTAASVRAAAVTSVLAGCDRDYVHEAYTALATTDYNAMVPIVQALHKGGVMGGASVRSNQAMLARCLVAFNPRKANMTRITNAMLPNVPDTMHAIYDARVAHLKPQLRMELPTLYARQ